MAGENPSGSEPSDAALVLMYRESGTDVAFSELIRRHQIAVFRLLLTLLGDPDEAERACEQTFFEAARKLDELGDPAGFPAWIAGVARGLVQKAEAAKGKKPRKAAPKKRPPPADPRGVVKQQVQGVLGELTNDERAALVLADLEGDSFESIGATLGTTAEGAEQLVELARSKFVDALVRRSEGEETAEATAVAEQNLEPGRVLGKRFQIVQRVGEGGMGAVFRATDLETGREVAVKTLLPEAAKDAGLRKRFEREAQILRKVEHPNFVRFVEYGSSDPAYVVMEFLDGSALSKLLSDESVLEPQRALHITRHVLTGLQHAHGLGIVHRDVKPDNVVIVHEPEDSEFAKILDFGIARLAEPETADKTKLTQKGEIFGTPAYMAPEQVRGDPIDPRADLYSVSVMLYEMLAARPPFVARNQNGLFAMHLASVPPPLHDWQPNLEHIGELQELLDVGLAKQPELRFASAAAYLERIDELIAGGFSGASPSAGRAAAQAEAGRCGRPDSRGGKRERPQKRPSDSLFSARSEHQSAADRGLVCAAGRAADLDWAAVWQHAAMTSTTRLSTGPMIPVRTLRVEVLSGPDAGRTLETEAEVLTVGTAPGNALRLTDDTVSRFHLELSGGESGISVSDLGSSNGTASGPVRIERGVVSSGAELRLGNTKLCVRDGDASVVELYADDELGELKGKTDVMRRLMAQVTTAARSLVPVLAIGESGTGKELVARAVHHSSPRASGPFVTLDCGALAPNLVASELFGHERGAFTSADRQHIGAFERASGGTLFLDEIGELPAELQPQLLGALERKRFRRVGGSKEIEVDVRIVCATNRDLRAEVNASLFRLDLYYRIAVVVLRIPALRERVADIPLLAAHFLRECGHNGAPEELLPESVMQQLPGTSLARKCSRAAQLGRSNRGHG